MIEEKTKRTLRVRCLVCGNIKPLEVTDEDYQAWCSGDGPKRHAQTAFPYLNAGDRELLISKTCGPCFDKLFAEPEEESL